MFGIDYAWGRPSIDAMKKAGVKFVARYVSNPGNSKNIERAEATSLKKAGIGIVTVFESTAGRALAGHAAGAADAKSAHAQIVAAGGPADAPIYFAVDFDAQPSQQAALNEYLSGAASVLGKGRVGVYGGYYVVERCAAAKVCRFFWQTYAWSGGHVSKHANLYQYSNGHTLDGVSCDYDKALKANYGQWGYVAPRWRFELWAGGKMLTASGYVVRKNLSAKWKAFHGRVADRLRREAIAGHRPKFIKRKKR